ncbi:uncharacterized protein BP01DRAFT_365599 [Aspergillus saccharolyticus JOP 1030-1]|uniref:CBF1-interacting co-repressor CIR N-terminal domain-containing protein n=1 Tax=Aspergillus saccharolyticus JOP 1030-1 TaxID=1450539 RepID=A0A318ZDF1_9EURO|nr:hypothetical protein BP01DRAFT_365599 [Aspergillus saccharolyticus JOP 1030-1]PYH45531.1 hypothetical protein BP01DRAFT_365599 [Aspergillus saccharolyticus JOP 1030-1]
MPLHLLGKKSWNVYNQENIARVRRDEAQAKAREEEEERRMQEVDAERRIKILRGERPSTPIPPPPEPSVALTDKHKHYPEDAASRRKRRRLAGENDTDRDIRIAHEDAKRAIATQDQRARLRSSDAPLHDSSGHIDLFPAEKARKPVEKNTEAEKESSKRQREFEDQYTMRFSNAAGFRQSVTQTLWYSSSRVDAEASESMPSKDVWGNEDPLRREREKARMDANDPLAAMKKGVQQLRSVERERNRWNEERKRELEELKSTKDSRSRRRRRRSPSLNSLEDFRLDASPDGRQKHHDRSSPRRHRHHHHHHHRKDRSRERSHRRDSHSKTESHHRRHDRRRPAMPQIERD